MRPSHLPSLGENAHPDTFLDGINDEDVPKFYIALDGKPSDRYIKNGHYCLATLIASSINTISTIGYRIQDELNAKGIKFQKLSNVRGKKRKNRYIHMVLDILINISNEEEGLPFNYRIALSDSEVLNPKRIIEYIESNEFFKKELDAEITDKNIIFTHNGNKVTVGHNEFGGMIWWHSNLLHIEKENNTTGKDISWWVHMDRLPLDHNCKKTMLFASYLDLFFKQKLWFSFTEGGDLPQDVLPDFYANLYYDFAYRSILMDNTIKLKIKHLEKLNTKVYWGKS